MNKKLVIQGIILGFAAPLLVSLLFVLGFAIYMHTDFGLAFGELKFRGQLANVLRIGLLANLALFTLLVRRKELVARGVVISTLVLLTISLLF